MSRFFVNNDSVDLTNNRITISGEDVKHIRSVLRGMPGDKLELSDGCGMDYGAAIEIIGKDSVTAKIMWAEPNKTEPPVNVTLFQGIPKADKMEYIIQKCVELGVKSIVPVITARTVVRFDNARDAAAKAARWKRIALEAAKQCDRGIVPVVEEPVQFDNALKLAGGINLRLLPYEGENAGSLHRYLDEQKLKLQELKQQQNYKKQLSRQEQLESGQDIAMIGNTGDVNGVAVFIGPEGGFAVDEVQKAVISGFKSVTLGPRILRTETAGVAVLAIIMYELGDMTDCNK